MSKTEFPMRLLFTSDLHGNIPAYERFAELLASESYDLGILAGDLLEDMMTDEQIVELTGIDPDELLDELYGEGDPAFFDWESRPWNRLLGAALDAKVGRLHDMLSGAGKPVLFVLGNHDRQEWPESDLVRNIHLKRVEILGQAFSGYRWTNGQRDEEQSASDFAALGSLVDRDTVLVTHAPPFGVLDSPRKFGPRVRRPPLLGICPLQELEPRLHLFGHVHAAAGRKGKYINGSWLEARKFFDIDVRRRRIGTIV